MMTGWQKRVNVAERGTKTTVLAAARSAERNAILSSCCGVLGEVTLTDSAVILLFAGMLGADARLAMLTTALLPLLNGFCIVPMAALAARLGSRRLVLGASALAGAAYFVAVAAPWFGRFSVAVLVASVFCFSLILSGFVAGWFPLLDTFLERERRLAFLGRMRLCHQAAGAAFLFTVGLLIGRHPQIVHLQAVLLVAALVFLGRAAFVARIPDSGGANPAEIGLWQGVISAVAHKRLAGFGGYVFALNLAAYGVVPLALLYMKNGLGAPDNAVVIVSATSLAGMLLGYAGVPVMVRKWKGKNVFRMAHATFLSVCLVMFYLNKGGFLVYALIAALLSLHAFFIAATSVAASSEMFARARAKSKTMDMALFGAFFYGGQGLSRVFPSILMGTNTASFRWRVGGFPVCQYQAVFLLAAIGVLLATLFFPEARIRAQDSKRGRGE